MSDLVCGHNKQVLQWALKFIDGPDANKARQWTCEEHAACEFVAEPTNVVSVLVSEGQRLGFSVYDESTGIPTSDGQLDMYVLSSRIRVIVTNESISRWLSFEQARAIVVLWMNMPNGDRVNAMHVLRTYGNR